MKSTMKGFLTVAFLLVMAFSVNAQSRKAADKTEDKANIENYQGRKGTDKPEDKADIETHRMKEKLDLSDKQAEKVKKINLEYAQKLEKARQEKDGDREQMQNMTAKIHQEKADKMKAVLSKEQYQKFEKMHSDKEGKRPERKGKASSRK